MGTLRRKGWGHPRPPIDPRSFPLRSTKPGEVVSKGYMRRFVATSMLSVVTNPFLFVQCMLLNFGQYYARVRNFVQPAAATGSETDERYRLPFSGEWLVVNGGVTRATSHSWGMLNQRYAYDFVKPTDEMPDKPQSGGRSLESFPAFGQPILAPADGTVIRVREGERDYGSPGTGAVDMRCRDIRGNHVLIQHRPDEFSLLAHLRAGSVAVAVGERVRAGQKIGECGNSGHSTEPHLHFHVQDRRSFYTACGKIIVWKALRRNGAKATDCADLARGVRVRGSQGL